MYMYMYYTQKEALTPTRTKVRACYHAVLLPMFCGVLTNTYMCFTRHEMGVSESYPISYYRGDSVVRQSGQLAAVVWMDNKQVVVMSTNVQPHEISTVRRMQSDATVRDVTAPMSIVSYNKWMGGVDRGDQMRQYYHLRLKSRKFYKYIFWFLVDVCIANSYIIHKTSSSHTCSPFKKFRLELAKTLIGSYNSRKRAARTTVSTTPRPPHPTYPLHFPVKKRKNSQKGVSRCWYCAHTRTPSLRKETFWFCEECDIFLCHTGITETDCFRAHHATML